MNKRTKPFIIFSTIIFVFALFIGSYAMRQNQQQELLTVPVLETSNDVYATTAEYGTMAGNTVEDIEELPGVVDSEVVDPDSIGDGSGTYGDSAPKLDKVYEDAMENSDLFPFEKEIIRMMVDQEDKSFAEALQSVRPGSTVVEEQTTETPAPSDNTNKDKPTTPTKPDPAPKKETPPSGNSSDSADYNNPDNRTDAQKEADANDPFDDGLKGDSDDTSYEPEL